MKISTSIDIQAKPETIFPWVAQPEKAKLWQKEVVGGEILEETPEKIGTTFKEEIEQDGKSLTMYGEITDYVPNNRIAFHIESKIHSFDVVYVIKDKGKKSTFTIDLDIKWKFPMNVMSMVMGRRITEGIELQTTEELATLKELCETL